MINGSAPSRTILLFSALLITTFAHAQNFEGKITYKNEYKSKVANVGSEQFLKMMGDTQEYYIKEGDYKSVSNGAMFQWQLYINADNKLYTKLSSMPAIIWNDGSTNTNEVIGAEINKGVTTILGYLCDELILNCKNGTEKFYFNSQLSVNPQLYEKHKYGNWHDVISRTKALPLKMIIETSQLTITSTAAAVDPATLDANLFTLPPDSKLAKSPY